MRDETLIDEQEAEERHEAMDYMQHEKTWETFTGLVKWAMIQLAFIVIGLFNNVIPFSLIVAGQTFIPSGLASILNATTPIFTVIVMAAAGEEALRLRRVAGVALGLAGVIILRGWGLETSPGQGLGILLCLSEASRIAADTHDLWLPPMLAQPIVLARDATFKATLTLIQLLDCAVALATTAPTLERARERVARCASSVEVLQWRSDVGDESYLNGLSALVAGVPA